MAEQLKRPIAVWIALVVLAFETILVICVNAFPPDESVAVEPISNGFWLAVTLEIIEYGLGVVSWVFAIVLVFLRKSWSRWFILASALCFAAYMLITEAVLATDEELFDAEYLVKVGFYLAFALVPDFVAVKLLSGESARRYFKGALNPA